MNREDIIRIAREAGFERLGHTDNDWVCYPEDIERFAALVIANHPPQSYMTWQEGYESGKQTEREACAKVCEDAPEPDGSDLAERIRARGQV